MIFIRGQEVDLRGATRIVSADMKGNTAYVICVDYTDPLADIVFTFATEEGRNAEFESVKKQIGDDV